MSFRLDVSFDVLVGKISEYGGLRDVGIFDHFGIGPRIKPDLWYLDLSDSFSFAVLEAP